MTKLRNITQRELKEMEANLPILPRTKEVVVSASFGGFGLSKEGEQMFLQLTGEEFTRDVARHHPALIHVVKTLGERAAWSSRHCTLKIVEVKDLYRIREYDGWESVEQPQDIEWISVED